LPAAAQFQVVDTEKKQDHSRLTVIHAAALSTNALFPQLLTICEPENYNQLKDHQCIKLGIKKIADATVQSMMSTSEYQFSTTAALSCICLSRAAITETVRFTKPEKLVILRHMHNASSRRDIMLQ
jgi:hypothetical protein